MPDGGGTKIADLFADLSLRATKFSQGLSQVVGDSKKAGSAISKALTADTVAGLQRSSAEITRMGSTLTQTATKGADQIAKVSKQLNETAKAAKQAGSAIDKEMGDGAVTAAKKVTNAGNVAGKSMKDVKKIVSGILISQAFYSALRTVKDAAAAVGDFSMQMEQANVSFTIMLGSAQRAQGMLNSLQDFAAKTPFRMQDATQGARRLMAMGFAAENVIPIMRDLSDAASISGSMDPEMLNRMVTALGQMQTKGKVATQELMQLSEAGLPSFQILREQLGLTSDQISKIGELNIPASKAIPALLKGIEQRYKGAADAISHTTGGLISTIKDDMLFLSSDTIKGPAESFRQLLEGIANNLEKYREGVRKGGINGLIAAMFPADMQGTVQVVLGSIASIGNSLKTFIAAFGPPLRDLGEFITRALALALPVLAALAKVISYVTYAVMHSTGPIRILGIAIMGLVVAGVATAAVLQLAWAVRILGIAQSVAKAVALLANAIKVLRIAMAENPVTALIMVLSAALLSLALSSKTVSAWLDRVMKQVASYMGISDALGNSTDATSTAIEDFNKNLADSVSGLGDVGAAAGAAGKKVKDTFIASFDEVHQIPENLDGISGALGDVGGLPTLPTLPDVKVPNVPDLSKILNGGHPPILPPPSIGKPIIPTPDLPKMPDFPVITLPKPIWPNIDLPPMPNIPPVHMPPPPSIDNWKQVLDSLGKSISDWAIGAGKKLAQWSSDGVKSISDWAVNGLQTVDSWSVATGAVIAGGMAAAGKSISDWELGALDSIEKVATDGFKSISDWSVQTQEVYALWHTNIVARFSTWKIDVSNVISSWSTDVQTVFTNWGANLSAFLSNTLNFFKNLWNNHKGIILGVVIALIAGIVLIFTGLPDAVMLAIGSLATLVVTFFSNVGIAAAAEVDATKTKVVSRWDGIRTSISNIWSGIETAASKQWGNITNTIKSSVNGIIGYINRFITAFDNIKISVPGVNIPGVGQVGGFDIGMPYIPPIPYLAAGAVVTKDQLVRVSEGTHKEGVIPLGGGGAEMVANALADAIAQRLGSAGGNGNVTLQVGVLVADDLGLKELERQLRKVRNNEDTRIHGQVGGISA